MTLQLGAGEPDIRGDSGQLHRHRGRGVAGESLLGQPALITQSSQSAHRCGAFGILVQIGQHLGQQHLVDLLTGEVGESDGLPDLLEPAGRIGERDAAARASQIAHHHDATIRCARPRGQRLQGCARVRDQFQLTTARSEGRHTVDRIPQGADRLWAPVRGDRCREHGWCGEIRGRDGVCDQDPHGLGQRPFGAMNGPVRGDDADRIADPADKSGEGQTRLARDTNLGRAVLMQGEDRAAHDGLALWIVGCRNQLSGADRQSQCVGHTYPFVLRCRDVSPRSPTVGDDGRHTP
ncbi:Uncharacterised protein [Mycobacteroides abscessus subsp. abscessus]|nr:Uncharacterised protein [Mycobacteroides abscessus subsp. abscessus]